MAKNEANTTNKKKKKKLFIIFGSILGAGAIATAIVVPCVLLGGRGSDSKEYTITWKNYDESTLSTTKVKENEMPVYDKEEPTRPSDAQYTYTFKGWTPEVVKATADATYTATFTDTTKKYLIEWYNDKDATVPLHTEEVDYGATPTYHWEDKPTKQDTDEIKYKWNGGWEEEIKTVTGPAKYHAKFAEFKKNIVMTVDSSQLIDNTASFTKSDEVKELFVDWGDGVTNGEISHTYTENASEYIIKIYGDLITFGTTSSGVTDIEIIGGITSISDNAFDNNTSLTSITIPNSITSIGDNAFDSCTSLTSITIPTSVTSMGQEVFLDCGSLVIYCIDESQPTGWDANWNSSKRPVYWGYISSGSTSEFEYIVQKNNDKSQIAITKYIGQAEEVVIPSTIDVDGISLPVTSIGDNAFNNNKLVNSITLPDNLTSIGAFAFKSCSFLTSVGFIPDSVTYIGEYAFADCLRLETINIPASLTKINDFAFNNVGSSVTRSFTFIGNIPGSVNYIGEGAFAKFGDTSISFIIPDGVTYIGKRAFKDCKYKGIIIPKNLNITEIKDETFSGCANLESITIPDSVTSIGQSTFSNCSSLTSINIPDNVMSIGQSTFYGCNKLASINIPDNVMSIGQSAFYGCNKLASINIPNGVTSIGQSTFYDCSSLTSINIPDSITSIGEDAFYNCKKLTSINLPNSVTSIGSNAFCNCSGLTSIDNLGNITSISSNTFSGCINLQSITIPDSVTSIGERAFIGCSNLASVIIPNSITSIDEKAFLNCNSLLICCEAKSQPSGWDADWNYSNCPVYWGYKSSGTKEGLNYIAHEVNGINRIVITKYIGEATEVIIPDTIENLPVTSIANYAFQNCASVTSITIPDSVTSIGSKAFQECTALTSINIPDNVTSIGQSAFYGCNKLASIDNLGSITSISDYTFYGCANLESITIPDSVTSIGSKAFQGCTALTSINIPDSITSIGEDAFYNCKKLTSIDNLGSITSINDRTFYGCINLESITIPDSVTSIGASAFYNCSSLTSINIPNGVTSIGQSTFSNCSSLTSINIPDNVMSIGQSAFYGCNKLASIDIPNSVTSIGGSAFRNCSSLTLVDLSNVDHLITGGSSMFTNCHENLVIKVKSGLGYKTAAGWKTFADNIVEV